MDILVDIEASIDYPEYDVEEVTNEKTLESLKIIEEDIKELERTFDNGKIIKERIKCSNFGETKCWQIFTFKCYFKRR